MPEKQYSEQDLEDMLEVPEITPDSPVGMLLRYKNDPDSLTAEEKAAVEKRMEESRQRRKFKLDLKGRRGAKQNDEITEEDKERYAQKLRDQGNSEEEISELLDLIDD